jgi:hypothetical protein
MVLHKRKPPSLIAVPEAHTTDYSIGARIHQPHVTHLCHIWQHPSREFRERCVNLTVHSHTTSFAPNLKPGKMRLTTAHEEGLRPRAVARNSEAFTILVFPYVLSRSRCLSPVTK